MIIVDSREQSVDLKDAADEVRLLRYDGPGGEVFSYDIEVVTLGGQTLRLERKQMLDFISSFEKLPRQLGPVDGLILEGWNPRALALGERWDDPKFRHLTASARKRMWRFAFSKAILPTDGIDETIAMLRYFESKTERIDVRQAVNPMQPYFCGIGGESFPTRQGLFDHKCSAASP